MLLHSTATRYDSTRHSLNSHYTARDTGRTHAADDSTTVDPPCRVVVTQRILLRRMRSTRDHVRMLKIEHTVTHTVCVCVCV